MASISALSVVVDNDKTYTFDPTGFAAPNVVEYLNKTGVPDEESGTALPVIGRPRIRITTVRATATRNSKVTVQIDAPVLASVSASTATGIEPPATRAYNPLFKGEFFLPRQSGEASRQRLFDLVKGMMAHAVIEDAVVDQEFPW